MSRPAPQRRGRDRDEPTDRAPGAPIDGAGRVRLRFLPDGAEVRVPSGTPVFDAASWNGIAIDSTCGGHGTCKKCKVRIVCGRRAGRPARPAGVQRPRSCATAGGWRAARRRARDLVVEVPPLQTRPKAALVGVGRHVILRPSVQKRHLVLEEPTMEDQRSDLQRVLDAIDDLEPTASTRGPARARRDAAQLELRCHRGRLRRGADRRRARRHHRAPLRDRVRPRHHDRGGHAARPRERPARSPFARCSTASSRSAPT